MISVKLLTASFLVTALSAVSPVQAALLTGIITGTVSSAGSSVPDVGVGTVLTGSYTYDTSAPFMGIDGITDPLTAFSLIIGTHVLTLGDLINGAGVVPSKSDAVANELFFFLSFSASVALSGDANLSYRALSIAPPEKYTIENEDPARSLSFDFSASPGIATAPVPEPQANSLLILGGIAFGAMRLRSRQTKRFPPMCST